MGTTIDLRAIADNLAGRFDPAQMPAAPSDARAIVSSSARLPQQLSGALPAVLVFMQSGTLKQGPSSHRGGLLKAAVRLYYSGPGSVLEVDLPAVTALAAQMLDQLAIDADLGSTVTIARVVGFTIGQLRYAGDDYTGAELAVELVTDTALSVTL